MMDLKSYLSKLSPVIAAQNGWGQVLSNYMCWNAAVGEGKTHYSRSFNYTPKCVLDDLLNKLFSMGFTIVVDSISGGYSGKYTNARTLSGHQSITLKKGTTFITMTPPKDDTAFIWTSIETSDKIVLDQITPLFDYKRPNLGTISLIKNDGCGSFSFKEIGKAGLPLIRENYKPEDVESFDYIVKGLRDPNPHGRLIIIDGKPGTGKTYYLRGVLNEISLPTFYYLTPGQVAELASPQLLDLWFAIDCKPIVLIIEDADECLVPRRGDNIVAIQSLLNLTDGMIGQTLDLRVICTTNAKRVEIDEALLRNGRLLKHVTLDALELEHANQVFQRLNPTAEPFKPKEPDGRIGFKTNLKERITLADVYQAAWEAA
jgi:hypothetical protein